MSKTSMYDFPLKILGPTFILIYLDKRYMQLKIKQYNRPSRINLSHGFVSPE